MKRYFSQSAINGGQGQDGSKLLYFLKIARV